MNKYESVVIINPNVDEAGLKALEDKFTGLINANGKVAEVENMGKKKLAYDIKKNKEAYYMVFKFEAKNGASIKNDISGAFCSTKGYCKSVSNHSSWNVTGSSKSRIKKVWCDTTYNCANDWNYVTSCAHVTCGGVTKNVCYRKKTNGGGEFTVVN